MAQALRRKCTRFVLNENYADAAVCHRTGTIALGTGCAFTGLPFEVFHRILRSMDVHSLLNLSMTCLKLYVYLSDETKWKIMYEDYVIEDCRVRWNALLDSGAETLTEKERGYGRTSRSLFCKQRRRVPTALNWQGSWCKTLVRRVKREEHGIEDDREPFQSMHAAMASAKRALLSKPIFSDPAGTCRDTIPRVDAEGMSLEDFISKFEAPAMPVIITGVASKWPCMHRWKIDSLLERYGDKPFKLMVTAYVTLREYMEYANCNLDRHPEYIFDSLFGDLYPDLLRDYEIPTYFPEDYLTVLDGDARGNFRWLLIGPPMSGSAWHTDYLGTNAWNASIVGRKRWLLYPPGKVPKGSKYTEHKLKGGPVYGCSTDSMEPYRWISKALPTLPDADYPMEGIVGPGEMIFVPAGWWHMVLNLDDTVAVTQNYCSKQNFMHVLFDMCYSEPDQAVVFIHEVTNKMGMKFGEDTAKKIRAIMALQKRSTDPLPAGVLS